jgi:hypothetical protein
MGRTDHDIIAWLRSDEAIAALLGAKIYPGVASQGATPPYAVYKTIGTNAWRSADGPTGMRNLRLQLNVWAMTEALADQVADAISGKMDGYTGTIGTTSVQDIVLEDETDECEESPEYEGKRLYGMTQFWLITAG